MLPHRGSTAIGALLATLRVLRFLPKPGRLFSRISDLTELRSSHWFDGFFLTVILAVCPTDTLITRHEDFAAEIFKRREGNVDSV